VLRLLRSDAMFLLLSNLTGLKLHELAAATSDSESGEGSDSKGTGAEGAAGGEGTSGKGDGADKTSNKKAKKSEG